MTSSLKMMTQDDNRRENTKALDTNESAICSLSAARGSIFTELIGFLGVRRSYLGFMI
jgi:hypothetical protein